MATEVIMPEMGESIAEGTITRWLVKVGDRVQRDQPLFEISTDKVDAEIPSPGDGVLLEVKFDEGATVPVNEIVAILGEPGEELAPRPQEVEEAVGEAAVAPPASGGEPAAEAAPEAGWAEAPAAPAEEAIEGASEESPPAAARSPEDMPEARADSAEVESAERVRRASSPVVRKMAAEAGIDLSLVEGSGIHGRVTKRDLERFLAEAGESPAAAPEVTPESEEPVAEAEPAPPQPAAEVSAVRSEPMAFSVSPFRPGENVEIVPMSKIRQLTAAHMRYSKDTSAHVTTVFHMDLSKIYRIRNRAKSGFAAEHGTKLTYMPFIFKAVTSALKSNQKLNASIDGTNVVYKKDINLGMAVALDWGLIVPVIPHADQLNLVGLAKTANDLAERARSKRLSPDEVQGGTFTVTNPGVFGSLFGTPIINQPQVAILGLGVIEKRPVVETDADGNDLISIKPMAYFAITYDHRLVDGADADEFMNDIKRTLLEETWSELDPFL